MKRCSLLGLLWIESKLFRDFVGRCGLTIGEASRTQMHVHHIFGGKSRKDLPSNLISVCAVVHEFCHQHTTEGRIACLHSQKTNKRLNWEEIDDAAGMNVRGWLEGIESEGVFEKWRVEVLRESESNQPATAQ